MAGEINYLGFAKEVISEETIKRYQETGKYHWETSLALHLAIAAVSVLIDIAESLRTLHRSTKTEVTVSEAADPDANAQALANSIQNVL